MCPAQVSTPHVLCTCVDSSRDPHKYRFLTCAARVSVGDLLWCQHISLNSSHPHPGAIASQSSPPKGPPDLNGTSSTTANAIEEMDIQERAFNHALRKIDVDTSVWWLEGGIVADVTLAVANNYGGQSQRHGDAVIGDSRILGWQLTPVP